MKTFSVSVILVGLYFIFIIFLTAMFFGFNNGLYKLSHE